MARVRHEARIRLVADLVIQPGEESPVRFAGSVFNASRHGIGVFSERAYPPGKLVGMELKLPYAGGGSRAVTVFGVTRWMKICPEGNILGVELLADPKAGDFQCYSDYLAEVDSRLSGSTGRRGRGFTLVEVCIAMVIMCLMVTLATPIFRRSIEQARVDAAAANLKTIWAAQRVYWLEYHQFSPRLSDLHAMDLIDSAVAASATDPGATYAYQLYGADVYGFTVRAARNSRQWTGQLQIDQDGKITGAISGPEHQVLAPAQQ